MAAVAGYALKALQWMAPVASTAFIVGCRPIDWEPPRLIQLSCKPEKSQDALIFLLDTGHRTARLANARAAVVGKLTIDDQAYGVDLPATAETQGVSGAINRFDGRLVLTWRARLHKAGPGDVAAGPDGRIWRCAKEKAGPKL